MHRLASLAFAAALSALLVPLPVKAQDSSAPAAAPKAPDSEEVVNLSAMVVTGSNIPTAKDATDVPVTVLGSVELNQTGIDSNFLDLLRKEIPAIAGRSDIGVANATNTNQNTSGGSQIQLRNLDTLVLVNGRRVATSGANANNGGKNFVDVAQIPKAAIDHIEVLTDGASAIYGSDAVGGVINIILKSNYEGLEIGGRYAESPNVGNYSEKSGYLTAGAGKQGFNLTVTGTWSETDPLWQSQRPFSSQNFQTKTSYPGIANGAYLNPSLSTPSATNPVGNSATASSFAALIANGTYSSTIPQFNLAPSETMLLQTNNKAATANVSYDFIPKKLVFSGDFMTSHDKSFEQTNGFLNNLTSVTVPAGAPYNPTTVAVPGVIVGNLNTPLKIFNKANGDRGEGAFRGEINSDWNWEVGGVYSQEKLEQDLVNELFAPDNGAAALSNVAAAIAGGYNAQGVATPGGNYSRVIALNGYPGATNYVIQPALDPFASSNPNPASLANLYGTEVVHTTSTLKGLDAKVVGNVFDLPAGKLAVAVGAATRTETLQGVPDQNSANLSTSPNNHNWGSGGVFFDYFSKSRTIDSYYAETRVPITSPSWNVPGLHALDLALAGRTEKYSDTGTSSVPKIGFRWEPFDDQVVVRYTYSKAFTAPDLWHEYGPPSVTAASSSTFFSSNVDPRLTGSYSYFSGNGNNPSLQPSHAWSRSVGFVFSPKALRHFTVEFNYIDVFQKGLPAGIGASNIVNSVNALGSASPYFSAIAIGAIPGTAGASQTALAAPQGLYNYIANSTTGGNTNLYIADHFVNSGGVHIESVDVKPAYEIPTSGYGTFTIASDGTNMRHFLFSALPGAPFYEFAGYSTNTQTEAGTFPHWSFYSTLDWKLQNWSATLGNTYMSSLVDIGAAPAGLTYAPANYLTAHAPVTVSQYYSWDIQLGYTLDKTTAGRLWSWLKGTKISVGVNNFTNRMPPFAGLSQAEANNNNNADTATYSPIGRLYVVSASVKF